MNYLPNELVEQILWRLPTKSILKYKSICKSWSSLITTPHFISSHLRYSKTQIFVHQRDNRTRSYSFHFNNDNQDYFHPMSLHLPHLAPQTYPQILGSINGLICISNIAFSNGIHIVNLILYNPSIQHFLSIPLPRSDSLFGWSVTGFGFDERTQDYKILLVDSSDGFVYSSNSSCWRKLITPTVHFFGYSKVFVNGGIHLLASNKPYIPSHTNSIIVFDVKEETFGEISLPECLANSSDADLTTMEFGESSIAVMERTLQDVTHIWVMKEYGLVESWIKLATVDSQVWGFRNKDQVLTRLRPKRARPSGCILSENINNKLEVKNLMNLDKGCILASRVYQHVSSLVLLDKANNVNVKPFAMTEITDHVEEEEELELRPSKRVRRH